MHKIKIIKCDNPNILPGTIVEANVFNNGNEAIFIFEDKIEHLICGDFRVMPSTEKSIELLKPTRVILEFNNESSTGNICTK